MKTSPHHDSGSPGYPAHKGLTAAQIALLAGMMGLTPSCDRSDDAKIVPPEITVERTLGEIAEEPQTNTFPVTPGQSVIEPNAVETPADQAEQQGGNADEIIFHTKGKIHVVPDDPAPAEKDAGTQNSQAIIPATMEQLIKKGNIPVESADKPNPEAIIPAPDEYIKIRGDLAVEPTTKE